MTSSFRNFPLKQISFFVLLCAVTIITAYLTIQVNNLSQESPVLVDSTLGELGIWMAEQSTEDDIESFLGNIAKNWALSRGEENLAPETALIFMRDFLLGWHILILGLLLITFGLFWLRPTWLRGNLLIALILLDALLFVIPALEGDSSLGLLLAVIFLVLMTLLLAEGKITNILGFFVALSSLFLLWEVGKFAAASQNYRITVPQASWEYQSYSSLEEALAALESGTEEAILFDRRDMSAIIPPFPEEEGDFAYPDLRLLSRIDTGFSVFGFTITPEMQGRLSVVVRQEDAARISHLTQFSRFGTVSESFAETNYLAVPRELLLVDLKIFNDLNLPHLQNIAEALLQPARRNGSQLLIRILGDSALFTLGEAFGGFSIGAILGFFLGVVFAHSKLLERALLPYVVASQTVPILAIAPMVVIWLGASQFSVAVIAAYLTFFPVVINTLRGLLSPKPIAVELMESYAASRWSILWKLRVPAALPYIFTALKVSATASVVGAIIGELPSGMGDGLARRILDFATDYSLVSTPKLWGTILVTAFVGIFFFLIVSVLEKLLIGTYVKDI